MCDDDFDLIKCSDMNRTLTVLGATGSIGQQTLDVVRRYPDEFDVLALTASRGSDVLAGLCIEFNPSYAVVGSQQESNQLRSRLNGKAKDTNILVDNDEVEDSRVYSADVVVTSIVGAAGLNPTLNAIENGNTVLITNKEPVVMLGPMLRDEVRKHGTTIVPVDSEHNAIFQCCSSKSGARYECFSPIDGLRRILLTGSGGPFRTIDLNSLQAVTPEQAVAHPVWNMGPKISVDSATMMNKGLEIIEARWLFETPADQIQVVVHPQGIVHSMVEYIDGSVLAQMGTPDMRVPLTFGLFWPRRGESGSQQLDLFEMSAMSFEPPDYIRFPCLKLAAEVARCEGTAPAVMNAANEIAVEAFLESRIRFTDIYTVVAHCVDEMGNENCESIPQVVDIDGAARNIAKKKVLQLSTS